MRPVYEDGRRLHPRSVVICLPVVEVDRAAAWYGTLFGRAADVGPELDVAEWELFPGAWLQLVEGRPPADRSGPRVRIGVADLAAAVDLLRDRDAPVGEVELVDGVVAFCEVDDPFGNRLTLFEVEAEARKEDPAGPA
jgi:hypothetical protein